MAQDTDDEPAASSENIRRVYALPSEMVDRINAFQREKGLPSEVEAVRRLLDEALKSRDDLEAIINRLLSKLGHTKIVAEAARDVLAGHPLVSNISFGRGEVTFELANGEKATVYENGEVSITAERWSKNDLKNPYAGGSISLPF